MMRPAMRRAPVRHLPFRPAALAYPLRHSVTRSFYASPLRLADVQPTPPTPQPTPVAAAPQPAATVASTAPPQPKKKKHRLRTFARSVLVLIVGSFSYIVYQSYKARHPPNQLPFDPSLPTIVVLGNGWGATSFLKKLDNEGYNVVVVSPRNYFTFTPLLPSVTVGTLDFRSIVEPTRFITRHMKREVLFLEAEASDIDPINKTVTARDNSEIKGAIHDSTLKYDYLLYAVGAENNTFGIPGVREHGCFLKEVSDAEKIRTRMMDCVESASFAGQPEDEVNRLLHMVVVGGGPTGVEYAGELYDFLTEDLVHWYPGHADKIKITLIEALPNVLPMFSKHLIEYATSTFKEQNIEVLTRTMVKEVNDRTIIALNEKKEKVEIPYGLLVWATGNATRPLTKDLIQKINANAGSDVQKERRGLVVDEFLRVVGAEDIYAFGDASATPYAATAQAASQQGKYLARMFGQMHKAKVLEAALEAARTGGAGDKVEGLSNSLKKARNVKPFHYSHAGSLAYIGGDKAIADLPFMQGNLATGGLGTMIFWRSAYISELFSLRNRVLVIADWVKVKILGRDVSRE
ncbi:FAD/NAD(P)-binding domain-containing protein [Atractiella rhizophila]|nr:FAD/NAD(P)-binding domain-containing protein [Atractiella rhizophila]